MANALAIMHPSDDALELYALGRLSESSLSPVEEHLLVCQGCQDRLVEFDSYIATMKQVCRENIEQQHAESRRSPNRFFAWAVGFPAPVWIGSVAVLTVALSVPILYNPSPGAETEIRLVASRGAAQPASHSGKVRLTINTSEFASYASYHVVIVDPSGNQVWNADVKPVSSILTVRPDIRLSTGNYWVRVSSPTAEPIREYTLPIK